MAGQHAVFLLAGRFCAWMDFPRWHCVEDGPCLPVLLHIAPGERTISMTMTGDTGEAQPSARSLWRNQDYLLLWCGQAISTIGWSVSGRAFPLLVLAVTGSPVQAGLVAALNALATALVTLPAGVLVDRWDRKRVMLFCDMCRLANIASIPLAMLSGHLSI